MEYSDVKKLADRIIGNIGKVMIGKKETVELLLSAMLCGGHVLLEDLPNLLANEMYSPGGGGADAVRKGLEVLAGRCGSLTVVTNEVFSGGSDYDAESLHYMKQLAKLNRALAEQAGMVAELVCGLPNVLKGELP